MLLCVDAETGRGYALPVPTLGENIRTLRDRAGLKQRELAERIGVTQGQLSNWETDRYDQLEVSNLLRIAKGLGISVNALLAGTDEGYDELLNRIDLIDHGGVPRSTLTQAMGVTDGGPADRARIQQLEQREEELQALVDQVQDVASKLVRLVALPAKSRSTRKPERPRGKRHRKVG